MDRFVGAYHKNGSTTAILLQCCQLVTTHCNRNYFGHIHKTYKHWITQNWLQCYVLVEHKIYAIQNKMQLFLTKLL